MGRGHSGSTILDILLGSSAQVESVGELVAGLSRSDREVCSCGAAMTACPFWSEVRRRVESEGVGWGEACQADVTRRRAPLLWRAWHTREDDPAVRRLAGTTEALAGAITATAGKQHVLDSSKTPARALFLLRHLPGSRAIHLVRDPRHVMQSYLWRLKPGDVGFQLFGRRRDWGKVFPLAVASSFWTIGNLLCELIARRHPGRVVRVRYEDLRAQPAQVLAEIGLAFGLDLDDVAIKIASGESFPVGHNIGGNRIRHEGTVRFDPEKSSRRAAAPRWLSVLTIVLCWPLMLRYGYLSGATARAHQPRRA